MKWPMWPERTKKEENKQFGDGSDMQPKSQQESITASSRFPPLADRHYLIKVRLTACVYKMMT
jgi:hypothetical protein